jgi:hypothetical protein
MKHPGDKIGNNVRCDLPPEAAAYIEAMPRTDTRIFPFSTDATHVSNCVRQPHFRSPKNGKGLMINNGDRFFRLSRFGAILFCVALVLIGGASVTVSSGASVFECAKQQILLKIDRQSALHPSTVISSGPDQLIVAGQSPAIRSAWATKVREAGGVIWTYVFAPHEDGTSLSLLYAPVFVGAVAMPDGTTFLCGKIVRPDYSAGLLIHLDAAGHEISARYIRPKERNAHGVARFSGCRRLGDRLVIVGYVWHVVQKGERNTPIEPGGAYWFLIVDADGKIVVEAQHRSAINSALLEPNLIVDGAGDGGTLFRASDNISTEIIKINVSGVVETDERLAGSFMFVQPVVADGIIQVFGTFFSAPESIVVLFLDSRLKEVRRVEGNHPMHFGARFAYRMKDGSFALFGYAKNISGYGDHSSITHVAADLKSESSFDFPYDKIDDANSVEAATPTSDYLIFAVARAAVSQALLENSHDRLQLEGEFARGAVIDFICFQ